MLNESYFSQFRNRFSQDMKKVQGIIKILQLRIDMYVQVMNTDEAVWTHLALGCGSG